MYIQAYQCVCVCVDDNLAKGGIISELEKVF